LRVIGGRSSLTIEEAEDRGAMKEKKRSWRGTIRQHREAESQGRCDEGGHALTESCNKLCNTKSNT
jgi:hypothetical protein